MQEQIANRRTVQQPLVRRATANPHKAGHYAGLHPEDQPYQSTELEEDDSYYEQRMPTSARRYQTTEGNQVIEQGNRRIIIHKEPPPKKKKRSSWVLFLGLGMLVMLALWFCVSAFSAWWTGHQLDSTYGFPRTYQINESVGFHDSQTPTHFIALNLNGQTEVIVCPASDCTKAVVYPVLKLFGDNAASVPVTLSFQTDVAHPGKLDMVVHINDQQLIFLNDGTQFKLQQ